MKKKLDNKYQSFYGLPQDVNFCKKCVISNQRPNSTVEFLHSISDKKEENPYDEQQSGNYLILNLCHHFDSKRSFTSMTLVRDTYGRRGSKK